MKSIIVPCLLVLFLGACNEFLSVKPDRKLAVPRSSKDLQALMDHVATMNYGFSAGLSEIASDNVFYTNQTWSSITSEEDRASYVWQKTPVASIYWNTVYRKVIAANTVIDLIDEVSHETLSQRNGILGQAKFFRAISFFDLVQLFAVPFDAASASQRLGIVLRLTSDINVPSQRATVADSYAQIIEDLESAAELLPIASPRYPTRPSKAAAYGALARCYLAMGNYEVAGKYADLCLQIRQQLLDYNQIEVRPYPFDRFNDEVIFYSELAGYSMLTESRLRVDTALMTQYLDTDLRLRLFFTKMTDGYYAFTGDYGQNNTAFKFNGITTSEMLLTRAECYIRNSRASEALNDLNTFKRNRYQEKSFVAFDGVTDAAILSEILSERRKELVFRGVRWSDIRRLDQEVPLELKRQLGKESYVLKNSDIKSFAFLIPTQIIELTGIEQN
ncbi:RagB/SusD family nutrient uptake outer membrane protein [Parapedobacter deserti]|uniref:RagB/SusD family nutrient uptake outer membrane protein n=1 Tax=Parapedobacter deserti TaxID=1912957 RepID=A0ABV7JM04_9SPHI